MNRDELVRHVTREMGDLVRRVGIQDLPKSMELEYVWTSLDEPQVFFELSDTPTPGQNKKVIVSFHVSAENFDVRNAKPMRDHVETPPSFSTSAPREIVHWYRPHKHTVTGEDCHGAGGVNNVCAKTGCRYEGSVTQQ